MLNGYLKPEKLEGDNKYHCEKCGSLEEAVKTTDILESPNHLKCTLMRFEYDRERGTKRKILTDIKYELSLNLPSGKVGEPKEEQVTKYAKNTFRLSTFLLFSESRNQAQFINFIYNKNIEV
jgi:ubiquitin C-terminal hydrolase